MKPELSERLFIEDLFSRSMENKNIAPEELGHVERLTGDASTRRYYRLFTLKNSYVVCIDNPTETGENTFVKTQEFLEKYNIRVPKILDRIVNKGYILEEDLGDTTLLKYLADISSREVELTVYKKIVDMMLELHLISKDDIENSDKFKLAFDQEKLDEEIKFSTSYFLKKFLNIEDDEVSLIVEEEFKKITSRLAEQKRVLTHRDFHSRNVMVKDGEFILIDFQDARMGIPQYDLVSLLEDCYYELSFDSREKLIEYYYENLPAEIHGQENFENFKCLYRDMALQRVFKAIGSFSYIYETRKDVRYVKYIGFAMEKLKCILLQDNKYEKLRKTLFGYYYES